MQKKIIPMKTAKVGVNQSASYADKLKEFYDHKGDELNKRIHSLKKDDRFIIAERGFGSALNFLFTWQCWDKTSNNTQQLHYLASESHPINKSDLTLILNHFPELSFYANQLLASYPPLLKGAHRIHFGTVCLTLILEEPIDAFKHFICDFNVPLPKELQTFFVDYWVINSPITEEKAYADAAPQDLLNTLSLLSNSKSTVIFNDRSKTLINQLETAGFTVQSKESTDNNTPPIKAQRRDDIPLMSKPLKGSPWQCHQRVSALNKRDTIAIIGAGLAGSIMAYRLAERGFKVTLFEKKDNVATQGSGNEVGMVHFKLSAFHSPLNDFMLTAYLYALRFYHSLDNVNLQEGIADLLSNDVWEKKQSQLNELAKQYPELIQFSSSDNISTIAKIPLSKKALYWPKALMLSPKKLCETLIKHNNISLIKNADMNVNALNFDKVILCTGTSTRKIPGLSYLPLEAVSGMVSYFTPSKETLNLKIGLTDKGYVLPATFYNKHVMGGSYHVENIALTHQTHLTCAINISPQFTPLTPAGHKSGKRAKTYDYLPYVGPLPEVEKFKQQYAPLRLDKNKSISNAAPYHNNKFILTGFGSHGLTTIPLSVEILLCQLLNEPLPVSQSQLKFLSPSRSLIKSIIKAK